MKPKWISISIFSLTIQKSIDLFNINYLLILQKTTMKTILILTSVLFVMACQQKQSKGETKDKSTEQQAKRADFQQQKNDFQPAAGGYYIKSNVPADESAKNLLAIINKNKKLGLVAHFQHHQMASSKGLALDRTHAVFFGNPHLGTPLIQKDQLIALDLPQKIITFDQGENSYLYRLSTSYLADRYAVSFGDLSKMTGALDGLSQKIADNQNRDMKDPDIEQHQGIITQKSNKTFDQAVKAIQQQIENAESINIMAELDHRKNADSVNMELRPTYVIMFGNPQVGIPLMQENRSVAVELPMKLLIYEDENGNINVAYKDMQFLFDRYKTNLKKNYGAKINGILKKIASSAI